jgi:hypothetical protein
LLRKELKEEKNVKTLTNIFIAVLITAAVFPAGASAATLEVGSGKPFATIQAAINAASAGDSILVYDGTYHEEIKLNKSLTVKSVNGAGSTIIDSTGFSSFSSGVSFSSGLGRETVLDGFTVAHGESFQGGNISCYNSSPTISNCVVYAGLSVFGAGIACTGGASPLITNCVVGGNLCAYGGGIYCSSSASPSIVNCTISQNRAANGGTVADANGAGIFCDNASASVINTIIWGNTANGMPNTIYLKNSGSVSVSYSDIEGGWAGSGNIDSDPQFVMPSYWDDAGTVEDVFDDVWMPGDFHLQATSPCIDTGTANNAPGNDIEGTLRPQGAGYEMGAYEYAPATLIELAYFDAAPGAGRIMLQWSTEAEVDNAGFNIYRADAENGTYIKINDELIVAQGASTQGAAYEFVDRDVKNRNTYWYKMEDVDLNGTSTFHGPVKAVPRIIYGQGR